MAGLGDLNIAQRGKRWGVGLLMAVIGVAVGYALPQSTASPKSDVGTVTFVSKDTGNSGVQFTFEPSGTTRKVSYTLENPTPWQQAGGSWQPNGQPACLVPGSTTPSKVTLGVVSVSSVGSAPGGPVVVWVECHG